MSMSMSFFCRTITSCLLILAVGTNLPARASEPAESAEASAKLRWVFFEPGSAALPKGARQALKTITREIDAQAIVTVAGEAEGDANLALARSQSLVAALENLGIDKNRIIGVVAHTPQRATSITWTVPVLTSARPRVTGSASLEGRPLLNQFDILLSDGHLAVTLNRWARIHGYQIEWATPIQVPVMGDLTLDASGFPEAVEQIIVGLRRAGYPLSARQAGKVIRVTTTGS